MHFSVPRPFGSTYLGYIISSLSTIYPNNVLKQENQIWRSPVLTNICKPQRKLYMYFRTSPFLLQCFLKCDFSFSVNLFGSVWRASQIEKYDLIFILRTFFLLFLSLKNLEFQAVTTAFLPTVWG